MSDGRPLEHTALLQAMDEACNGINPELCQAWICHAKRFFRRRMNNEDILL